MPFPDVISLNLKPKTASRNVGTQQTVDIAPLLGLDGKVGNSAPAKRYKSRLSQKVPSRSASQGPGLLILRRKTPKSRNLNIFQRSDSPRQSLQYSHLLKRPTGLAGITQQQLQQNRRSFDTSGPPSLSIPASKAKLMWMAMHAAQQRQRALNLKNYQKYMDSAAKSQYYRSVIPLLYHYKIQKQAAAKYHAKYLRTLQLLALATRPELSYSFSPELGALTQSFKNSPYGSLLSNSSFIATNSVDAKTGAMKLSKGSSSSKVVEDQIAEASERSDDHHPIIDDPTLQRELEKQKRKLLEVFPPPHSEIPFGERTILMVRFPPVPEEHHHKKPTIKLKTDVDIDGGITFGGPRWLSFGTPFDPFDHPWYHTTEAPTEPSKIVWAEANKPSSYGVIITQNFIHRPSIRFTNSDPKWLAKHKGDLLNGGPSIVAQLAKTLAEGNRISNSYYLSKNAYLGKTWANPEKKPPFVIVHLDTYTKKSNETGNLGLDEDVEANYANGTIIYPTKNNPHILASTKFEFHDAHEISHIFDNPLAIHGHGYGWGKVPVYPKGINEIKNFLRLMYKVHQEGHERARQKSIELKKFGDHLERPALLGSKPLLRDQIADRSINWLHTSSVGIRSLSEDDDQFPYDSQPVVDVSEDYDNLL